MAQKKAAQALMTQASLQHHTDLCGLGEVAHLQAVLPHYQIRIISQENYCAMVYMGPEAEEKINLLLYRQHFDIITSLPAFFCQRYWFVIFLSAVRTTK